MALTRQAIGNSMGPEPTKETTRGKIWIDLDNSPHVPFFAPIIEELEKRGYEILLTGRDCFQVRELVDLLGLRCNMVGHHSGKVRIRKLVGLCMRAAQMTPFIRRQKPMLAISHGSRSQLLVASLLGLPSLFMSDYEFAKGWVFVRPTWFLHPEVIPDDVFGFDPRQMLQYPGIKEDVYAPRFKPNSSILSQLGINGNKLVVTLRPPANEAHYHNPESDLLFTAVVKRLSKEPNTIVVLLPRNKSQEASIRESWPDLFASGKIIVPGYAVDGMNLIWHSDLVISGGGTMNREATALGVPVYSIFRGKIGAVDDYLARQGRLTIVENLDHVQTRILLTRRHRNTLPESSQQPTLNSIVGHIVKLMEEV